MSPVVSGSQSRTLGRRDRRPGDRQGAGGLSAALVCRAGRSARTDLRKLAYVGGTTATSGGGIWVPGTKPGWPRAIRSRRPGHT